MSYNYRDQTTHEGVANKRLKTLKKERWLYGIGGFNYRALTRKFWWFLIGSLMGGDCITVAIHGGSNVFILTQRKYFPPSRGLSWRGKMRERGEVSLLSLIFASS